MSWQVQVNCTFKVWFDFMVFNATFNNIPVISWSVLLVEETGGPGETVGSHRQTLSHNVVHARPD